MSIAPAIEPCSRWRPPERITLTAAVRFADTWAHATDRFISAVWASLTIPSTSSLLVAELNRFNEWVDRTGFGPDCFATPESRNLFEAIYHAHDDGERPTVDSVFDVIYANGWEPEDIGIGCNTSTRTALRVALESDFLSTSQAAAGMSQNAAIMVDCRNRTNLARRMQEKYRRLLDPTDPIEGIVDDHSQELTAWKDRNAS